MAPTGGPEAEFGDPRRKELLQALNDVLPTKTIRPTAWACLWLSDIDKLQDFVAQAQAAPSFLKIFFGGSEVQASIVPTWNQRKRLPSTTSTPQNPTPQPPSTPLQPSSTLGSRGRKRNRSGQLIISRSKLQRDQCRQRDQRKCILTNAGEPVEVAHIYPFSMRYEDDTVIQQTLTFWEALRIFWSKERIDTWYNAIFSSPDKTEVCQNLLCLCPNAHAYWERAYFALKPMKISDDKKRLDVQFFWLSSNTRVPGINILQAPSLSALDHGPNLTMLFDSESRKEICSGDEISLQTDDPVSRPLPDFSLLEMQWFLHRVTAMSGAAEPQDDLHDDDHDNDIVPVFQDQWDAYTEDTWDTDIDEVPTADYFEEGRSLAQAFEIPTFIPVSGIRGGRGHRQTEDDGEDSEEEGSEGEGSEGEGNEGEGSEGEEQRRQEGLA